MHFTGLRMQYCHHWTSLHLQLIRAHYMYSPSVCWSIVVILMLSPASVFITAMHHLMVVSEVGLHFFTFLFFGAGVGHPHSYFRKLSLAMDRMSRGRSRHVAISCLYILCNTVRARLLLMHRCSLGTDCKFILAKYFLRPLWTDLRKLSCRQGSSNMIRS